MKQHITKEQVNSLSESGKKALHSWWKPQKGNLCLYLMNNGEYGKEDQIDIVTLEEWENLDDALPLLSIGQMIEYLDEHYGAWMMESWQEWGIIDQTDNRFIGLSKKVELCDALWEAVKQLLEEEKV